ncbi:MAG: methyltransferase [Chloroflexi bacterium]|nr:methyltransferase [Chloroflexota bacterium]
MNGRERVVRALRFQQPDRVPRQLWYLPGVEMYRQDELAAMLERFPPDIVQPQHADLYGRAERAHGTPNVVGRYRDDWGCEWTVAEPGVIGEVKHPPLAAWSALDQLTPPWEILTNADLDPVRHFCDSSDRFVNAGTSLRPFERMQFLRGTEDLFIDLAYGDARVLKLRDMIHDFYMHELELWAATDVDAITFIDDWGSQTQLLISPDMWRQLFKPLYADYCRVIRDAGKFVFMHSDGQIEAIYPDLIEIGVHALNSQLFCMDIERLGRQYQGKVTFWGEIDRQHVLPYGSVAEVVEAVNRVRGALNRGQGGVIAQCEWGNDVPAENVTAVFEAWLE